MPLPTVPAEFLDMVRKSGLLDPLRLDEFLLGSAGQARPNDTPKRLARRMVRAGLLTPFQALLLLEGKYRGFQINQKYRLLDLVGSGGMGRIFLCEHVRLRRLVALKVLPDHHLSQAGMLQRFEREARVIAALDHPNLVRAHDIDQDGDNHFLVMEYIDGTSFFDLVRKHGPMAVARAAHYIAQAAMGLQHAHDAGIVHRDIKPGNLLLDRTGTVKVLDLGLARFFGDTSEGLSKLHGGGVVQGTMDYLSPEQAVAGAELDGRSDIYSLGATLFFLLAGKAPFDEGSMVQKLIWAQMREPPALRELRPDVPVGLAAVVAKMMAKDPVRRYQQAAEVAVALAEWTREPIAPPPEAEMPRHSLAVRSVGQAGASAETRKPPSTLPPGVLVSPASASFSLSGATRSAADQESWDHLPPSVEGITPDLSAVPTQRMPLSALNTTAGVLPLPAPHSRRALLLGIVIGAALMAVAVLVVFLCFLRPASASSGPARGEGENPIAPPRLCVRPGPP